MSSFKEINEEIQTLLNETDEEVLEEVKEKYAPFEENTKILLECENLESYLQKYEQMLQDNEAVLKCFNLDTTDELKTYIEANSVDFDKLKIETLQASCEALKFAIYDSEELDDY